MKLSLEQMIILEYLNSPVSPRTWRSMELSVLFASTNIDSGYACKFLGYLSPDKGHLYLTTDNTNNVFKASDAKVNNLIRERIVEGLTSPVDWIRARAELLVRDIKKESIDE